MSTRISKFALAPAVLIAACAPESGAPEGPSVECALGEGETLVSDCVLEASGGGTFTIHHPDASFQRIRFDAESGELSAADGADEMAVSTDPKAGTLEFTIGGARYRVQRSALLAATQ